MIWQSVLLEDAFGGNSRFVWFDNFAHLFSDASYYASARLTWCSAPWLPRSGWPFRCCWQ